MSQNKDNTQLDEMMRKLKKQNVQKKSSDNERGERVIRANGSEAIKVKSKKRRTIQPKIEKEKRNNKRKIILLVASIALFLISIIVFSILLGYYNGNRFKSKITDTIINVSGADVELGKLDISPAAAKLSKISLKWPVKDSVIKKIDLKGIDADYGMLAFIGGGWGGSNVGIDQADLSLEMANGRSQLTTNSERPVDFKFSLYQCSELNINFGQDSLWNFSKGSASYRVTEDNDEQFSIDSGDFSIPRFGDFSVNTGLASFDADQAHIYLSLRAKNHSGVINIDGTTGYTKGSSIDLKTKLEDYTVGEWMDTRARRFIKGKIESGNGTLKMKLGDIESFDIVTKMTSGIIRVNDFEFVNTLSKELADDEYLESMFRGNSKMTMRWSKRRIEFSDIDFKQEGKLRIKGNFTIDENDQMSGNIKVGLPVIILTSKKVKILNKVFKEDDGEYIWANLTIAGKVSLPEDDLNEMFKKASIELGGKQKFFEHKFNELSE